MKKQPPRPQDGYGHTIKPSDTVLWDWSTSGNTVRLKPMGKAFGLFDKTDGIRDYARNGTGWSAVIRYETEHAESRARNEHDFGFDRKPTGIAGLDSESEVWTLTTRGNHNGSTRHRTRLTLTEAHDIALAWLDRRFSAFLWEEVA